MDTSVKISREYFESINSPLDFEKERLVTALYTHAYSTINYYAEVLREDGTNANFHRVCGNIFFFFRMKS